MEYWLHLATLVAIYAILALSLNLVAGVTGMVSLAQGAFFGIGAYASALAAVDARSPFLVGVALAMASAAAGAVIVVLACLRLRDEYLVVATFGLHMIVFGALNNWTGLTRGPLGIGAIPRPSFFGLAVSSAAGGCLMAVTCLCGVWWVLHRLVTSPFGRTLRAIREDEVFAQSLGKDVGASKASGFIFSAACAGLAGALYAHHASYIDPTSFTVNESILIISMVIIGGRGSLLGSVLGAALLVITPELLRFVGVSTVVTAQVRQLLYGLMLLGAMLWRPQGFMGERLFAAVPNRR